MKCEYIYEYMKVQIDSYFKQETIFRYEGQILEMKTSWSGEFTWKYLWLTTFISRPVTMTKTMKVLNVQNEILKVVLNHKIKTHLSKTKKEDKYCSTSVVNCICLSLQIIS